MRRLADRWSLSVFILFLIIKFLQALKRLGIRPRENGWRKVTRAYLRTEHSKFVLACMGLDFRAGAAAEEDGSGDKKARIIGKLAEFFRSQPQLHWKIQWGRFSARMVKKDFIDIVLADFDEYGSLKSIVVYLDHSAGNAGLEALDARLKEDLIHGIIKIYNQTRELPDKKRPVILSKELREWLLAKMAWPSNAALKQARCYADRVLSADFIRFEEAPAERTQPDFKRFTSPDFIKQKHPGFGLLNIVCRLNAGDSCADLWFQCNHVPIDGLPIQEALDELKKKWAGGGVLKFPPASQTVIDESQLCSSVRGEKGVYNLSRIINFRPLIGMDKELCKQCAGQQRRAITVLRLFIWKLGNHPVFKGLKLLIPAAVPGCGGQEKTLGFVLIRPSIYFDKYGPEQGFLEFQREFNRQVKAIIARKNESYELFECYALLPITLYSLAMKLVPAAIREFVGTVGVTIINKADVFISPYSDVHCDGFIAVSNFFTPTEDGQIGCYVSIKGPKDRLNDYMAAIEEIAAAKA